CSGSRSWLRRSTSREPARPRDPAVGRGDPPPWTVRAAGADRTWHHADAGGDHDVHRARRGRRADHAVRGGALDPRDALGHRRAAPRRALAAAASVRCRDSPARGGAVRLRVTFRSRYDTSPDDLVAGRGPPATNGATMSPRTQSLGRWSDPGLLVLSS